MPMKKQAGIYRITVNRGDKPAKHYIGQSIFMNQRGKHHLRELRRGKHFNIYLQKAFNEFGVEATTFSPIIVCEPKAEILQIYEQTVVDSMDPDSIFNIKLECVISSVGIPASEERKGKIAAALTGIKRSLDTRDRIAAAQAWKKTPEGRARIAAQMRGRKPSDQTRAKMSKAQFEKNTGNRTLKYGTSWILAFGA